MDQNYRAYMKESMERYIGEWVAICNHKIISHGPDFKMVFKEAKDKCPKSRPLITRVPDKETMIF